MPQASQSQEEQDPLQLSNDAQDADGNRDAEAQDKEEMVVPDQANEGNGQGDGDQDVAMMVEDEVVSQQDEQPTPEDAGDQDHDRQDGGEVFHHHVEFIEDDQQDGDVEYHIEEDDDDGTSEIILCVDTSTAGDEPEFEVIQQPVFVQKSSPAKIISKPSLKPGPKVSKPGSSLFR